MGEMIKTLTAALLAPDAMINRAGLKVIVPAPHPVRRQPPDRDE
ncbi:hypothetical protein [Mesorhizobium sp. ORS 3428]|nr:hypothetical protein [Mesorhizobium sp. ORS 3428]